jgi:HEAT repeat protein
MAFVKRPPTDSERSDERDLSRDLSGLLVSLKDADPSKRRWAARDLVQYPTAALTLTAQLLVETDLAVRKAILLTLTQVGSREAIDGLVNCLCSEDVALRNEAIEAMTLMPNEVVPLMNSLLRDPDPDVRIFSVNVLESLKHPHVEQWLIDVISNDDHINVCATAVDLLVEVGTAASIVPLQHLKEQFSHEPYIVFAADLAIKRIQGA